MAGNRSILTRVGNRLVTELHQNRRLKTYDSLQFLRNSLYKRRRELVKQIPDSAPTLATPKQEDGYVVWDLAEFDLLQEVIAVCREIVVKNQDKIDAVNKAFDDGNPPEDFIKNPFIHFDIKEWCTIDSPLLRFGLHPSILKPVSEYTGMIPILSGISLWYSPNRQEYPLSSQSFHVDMHDRSNAKLFVYVEDVDEDTGPLTVIPVKYSRQIEKELDYKMKYVFNSGDLGSRIPDETIDKIVGLDKAVSVTGPSGTAFIADTDGCFHYGSRGATKPRYSLQYYFEPPFAFGGRVFNAEQYKNVFKLSGLKDQTDSEIEKLVLGF